MEVCESKIFLPYLHLKCSTTKICRINGYNFFFNNVDIFIPSKIILYDYTSLYRIPELEVEEETQVQEMTLDEWKNLQEQTRPKPEFNIRKPESTVPSKAVVIHKSKYRDDMVKDDYEDDSHVFRKPANDITSQLEINFGNLPRPGRGARGGTRGGRGRIRRAENYGPRAEVVMQDVAPNPDDPEDFPALS